MSESGPQPTAQEIATECKITRRRALQSVGLAAGATATGVTFGTETATAADGLVDGVVSAIPGATTTEKARNAILAGTTPGAAIVMGAVAVGALKDSVNSSPSADRAILHSLCVSAYEDQVGHEDTFENRLVDAESVDDIEARHGIASAWEDGEGSSGGYDRALSRIRQYYELPEFNHWHVTGRHLLQLGYAGDAAVETGSDAFVAATGTDGSGNNVQFRFRANPTEVDLELNDGTMMSNVDPDEVDDVARDDGSTTLRVPMLHVRDTTNGTDLGTTPALEQSVVDSWDSSAETLTYDVEGTTCTLETDFVIPNVNDSESAKVWDVAETFKLQDQIVSQSDAAVGDYSQSFVEDIYAELDAGNITPDQVRSPAGVARFLSGTDDQASSRFRLAMLQQLGMEQPDFSRVANMTVTWTGSTDRWVDTDPDLSRRNAHPSEFVDAQSYTGILFGDDLPAGGFQPAQRYKVGRPLFVSDGSSVKSVSAATRDHQWDASIGSTVNGTATNELGETVFVAANDGVVYAIDATDGSTKWSYDTSTANADAPMIGPNGSLYVAINGGAVSLDPADSTENWTYSGASYDYHAAVPSPDGSVVYATGGDGEIRQLDAADGTQNWTDSGLVGTAYDGAVAPDGAYAYAVDENGNLTVMTEGGTQEAQVTVSSVLHSATTDSNGNVYVGDGSGTLYSRTATGGSQWSHSLSASGGAVVNLHFSTNETELLVMQDDGSLTSINTTNQTENWTATAGSGDGALSTNHPKNVDGVASAALMFEDESTDEVPFATGVVHVDEMNDRDGATVTHVTDTTISDIEALSATPDSIDTIVDELDQFDAVEDIKYTKHVNDILEFYGSDATVGNEDADDVTVDEPDYQEPKYNTQDTAEFSTYLSENLESYKEMLAEEESSSTSDSDDPLFGGLFSEQNGGQLAGLAIVALVVMGMVSAAINKIPLIGK